VVGLYPVLSALFGFLLLGERLTRPQAAGESLAMTGIMQVSV
jgi:drug/metabolite transporter (DMT)-like permease